MRVIVVTMRGWSEVGLWIALCFLAKISVHKYILARLIDTVTGNLAVNSVFITFRSMRETKKFHFFSFFKTLFYTKLPFPLPWWSKDLLVKNLQVTGGQLRNPPVQIRRDLWLHDLAIDQHPLCPNLAPAWTLISEMVPFGSKSLTLSM